MDYKYTASGIKNKIKPMKKLPCLNKTPVCFTPPLVNRVIFFNGYTFITSCLVRLSFATSRMCSSNGCSSVRVLQYMANGVVICRILQCKRPSFRPQKTTFRKPADKQIFTKALSVSFLSFIFPNVLIFCSFFFLGKTFFITFVKYTHLQFLLWLKLITIW